MESAAFEQYMEWNEIELRVDTTFKIYTEQVVQYESSLKV